MNMYDVMYQQYAPDGTLEGTFERRLIATTRGEAEAKFNRNADIIGIRDKGYRIEIINVAYVGPYDAVNQEPAPDEPPKRSFRQFLLTYVVHQMKPEHKFIGGYKQFVYAYDRGSARAIFLERADIKALTEDGKHAVAVMWMDDMGPYNVDAYEGTGPEPTN